MRKIILSLLAISAVVFVSCNNDDDNTIPQKSNLGLNITGLENLGANFKYEGWIIVNGSPVSTGTFTVDDSGKLSQTTFSIDATHLASASKFVLSIEPSPDNDPKPAATKILAGDFSGTSANVTSAGIVGDFSSAAGKYILATPTDGAGNNEFSGVWFLDNSGASPIAGLTLPTLTDGWKYEGWAVINGKPVSTGTFSAVNVADDNAATSPYKGDMGNGPAYPGEDYIKNAPAGLTFPTDLRDATIVISVEPDPDNSPNPFTLKPLAHKVPTSATEHTVLTMGSGPTVSITGTVTR